MKSQLRWRAVERVARTLDASEREAVLGDLAESGQRWNRALGDVLGLVIRREAALWMSVRPWLILLTIVLPLGLLISILSRLTSLTTAVYIWMYANNSDWELLRNVGFWRVLPEAGVQVFIQYVTLACWAWTIGFVVGAASRKIARSVAFSLFLVLLIGEISFAPRYLAFYWQLRDALFPASVLPAQNDPVSAIFFYRSMFPFLVQIVLVGAPVFCGVGAGIRSRTLTTRFRVCVWIAAIATVTSLVMSEPGLRLLFYPAFIRLSGLAPILRLVVYWPVAYLLTTKTKKRLSTRVA